MNSPLEGPRPPISVGFGSILVGFETILALLGSCVGVSGCRIHLGGEGGFVSLAGLYKAL